MSRTTKRTILAAVLSVVTGLLSATAPLPQVARTGPVSGLVSVWNHSRADAYYGTSRRVSRRTSRRTATRQNQMYSGTYYPGSAVAGGALAGAVGAPYVTSLPPDCTTVVQGGATVHQCGGSIYRPAYQGDTLVYVEE
ncbi:MAG: hypothetical protein IRZ16_02240 [Myxococcaceae bacterium]|nr:hypothetical protein [Myxococcaceae bacterium]